MPVALVHPFRLRALWGLVLTFCGAASATAQGKDGLFITVPNPIKDDAIQQIRLKIDHAIKHKGRAIGTVVFDFNPKGQPSSTSDFYPCASLADFIRDLPLRQVDPIYPSITTVAFVHHEVTKHTVLPVLACKELVMADLKDERGLSKAKLGNVTRDLNRPLLPMELGAYKGIGDVEKRPFWREPLQRMLEGGGKSLIDADEALKLQLCKERHNSRIEVKTALGLSRQSLAEDWLVGQTPVAYRIEVQGELDIGKRNSIEDKIKKAIGENANLLIFELRSEGGQATEAGILVRGQTTEVSSLAKTIAQLKDNSGTRPIKTVAYVPGGVSLGAACYLALGCTEIVMAPDSVLADFSYLKDQPADALRTRWETLAGLAAEQGYPPLLFQAALDKDLILQRVKLKNDPAVMRLVRIDDKAKGLGPGWDNHGLIDRGHDPFLKITADLAREWGIALSTDIDSLNKLYGYYGLEPQRVKVIGDSWLDRIAEFFREPTVRFILIMLGVVGLIMELKLPGTTVPGVIAAVCFVLFFWASSFVGEFTLLAVLLFILGLILIGAEIFVMPGTTFPVIAGIALILTSLVLVGMRQIPQTSQDWFNLGTTIGTYALSLVAAMALVFVLAWYLPSIPYANRLVLRPPSDEDMDAEPSMVPNYAGFLGAMGVAVTPLRPAGKAQFGDDFLDVIAEGDYVAPGARVQVIEIEGNRIVVKEM